MGCRDGTDTPVVCAHTKFPKLLSTSVPNLPRHLAILFQHFSTQRYPKSISRLTARKWLNHQFVHLSSLRDIFQKVYKLHGEKYSPKIVIMQHRLKRHFEMRIIS